jgi:hypothetical protein
VRCKSFRLHLEKPEGDTGLLMTEDARRCARIHFFWLASGRNITKIRLVTVLEFAFVNRRFRFKPRASTSREGSELARLLAYLPSSEHVVTTPIAVKSRDHRPAASRDAGGQSLLGLAADRQRVAQADRTDARLVS